VGLNTFPNEFEKGGKFDNDSKPTKTRPMGGGDGTKQPGGARGVVGGEKKTESYYKPLGVENEKKNPWGF